MSWAEGYYDYPESVDKETIMREIDDSLENERGRYDPVFQGYVFSNMEPFEDRDKALEYLYSDAGGKYYRNKNFGVRYYSREDKKKTKKMQDLERRISETEGKMAKYIAEHSVSTFKAEFIGCPECKSKIAKRFIPSTNKCPLCGADLRSETTIKILNGYKQKIKELNKLLETEIKKNQKKGEVYWLISAQLYIG